MASRALERALPTAIELSVGEERELVLHLEP
jgi:hypothetical protein